MKNNKEVLSSLLKTTQMGQIGIRSVLDTGMEPELRQVLNNQLREYDSLETQVHALATQRGWELRELDPAMRFWTDRMTRLKLGGWNTDSKIADMMIQGNTRGMVKGLKNIHQLEQQDDAVQMLSQKLLDCEQAHIHQMQQFL